MTVFRGDVAPDPGDASDPADRRILWIGLVWFTCLAGLVVWAVGRG
jgi:hypothetical protein